MRLALGLFFICDYASYRGGIDPNFCSRGFVDTNRDFITIRLHIRDHAVNAANRDHAVFFFEVRDQVAHRLLAIFLRAENQKVKEYTDRDDTGQKARNPWRLLWLLSFGEQQGARNRGRTYVDHG